MLQALNLNHLQDFWLIKVYWLSDEHRTWTNILRWGYQSLCFHFWNNLFRFQVQKTDKKGFDRLCIFVFLFHHSLGSFQGFQLHKFIFGMFDKRREQTNGVFIMFFMLVLDDDYIQSYLEVSFSNKVIGEFQKQYLLPIKAQPSLIAITESAST